MSMQKVSFITTCLAVNTKSAFSATRQYTQLVHEVRRQAPGVCSCFHHESSPMRPRTIHRIPLPRGRALGRARCPLAPRVAYRLVAAPRVVPRDEPREGTESLEVCFEETVLGGCSTKEVPVLLQVGWRVSPRVLVVQRAQLTGKSSPPLLSVGSNRLRRSD